MKTKSKSIFNIFTVFALLASLIGSAVFVTPAYAAGYVVNTLNDDTTDDAFCTLREAINAANNTGGSNTNCGALSGTDDTITFSVSGTIVLGSVLPNIVSGQGQLTIDGGDDVTVSGNNAARVMRVNSSATLALQNITIANGNSTGGGGGGILNDGGTLTVTNSTFSGNSVTGGFDGGGIHNNSGTLTITNSTFSGNSAGNDGGGIFNSSGTANITNSTFSGNSAVNGGGIRSHDPLTITNSTFSGNSATGNGGGILNGGRLTITNSTFSGNSATGNGGGIAHFASSATLTVTNSTFSGNGASANNGGGIYRNSSTGTVTLKNTIVANSTSGGNCGGTITDGGNNLDSANTCVFTTNAKINTDPNLGALADNGGPTQTFALLAGSSAINAGNDTICGAAPVNNLDQRGFARGLNGPHCDIGAYEYQDTTAPTVISNSLVTSYTTGPSSFAVTFGENVYDPAGNTDTEDVTNPANYLLVEDGANGTFNTFSCIGGLVADDTQVTVTSVTYIPNTSIINFGSALPAGTYRLFVCGTTSIVDLALNPINGGTDTIFNFVVASGTTTAASLPKTGFAPHKVTSLPAQPASLAYSDLGSLWLEIPSQDIKSTIVGVPKTDKGWDTFWLANDTGWLNGTAFPTRGRQLRPHRACL